MLSHRVRSSLCRSSFSFSSSFSSFRVVNVRSPVYLSPSRCIDSVTHHSSSGIDELQRAEYQRERNFVNQYEKDMMNRLLSKMNEFVTVANEKTIGELAEILTRNGVEAKENLKKDLIGWKHAMERREEQANGGSGAGAGAGAGAF